MEKIGIRLKRIRLEMGLSQQDLAERMNVRRETIGRWERAKHAPQLICFNKLDEMLTNFETIIELSNKL